MIPLPSPAVPAVYDRRNISSPRPACPKIEIRNSKFETSPSPARHNHPLTTPSSPRPPHSIFDFRLSIFPLLFALCALPLPAQDRVHLKDGRVAQGRLLNLAKPLISMELQLPGVRGSAKREFDAGLVDFIDFAPLPGEAEALANPAEPKQQDVLLQLWQQKSVHLPWPANNAGDIGLALADQLLKKTEPELIERAFRIYSLVEKDDWDNARRAKAKTGRLRSLIGLKRIDEAIKEAQIVARESEDPAVLIEAQIVIANADFEKLKRFDLDHPRWDQDDELTEERTQLYQQVLDQFLHTPLFHGSVEDRSAEALWQVVQVHQYNQEALPALERARDLVQLYPKTPQAAQAQNLLGPTEPIAPGTPASPNAPKPLPPDAER